MMLVCMQTFWLWGNRLWFLPHPSREAWCWWHHAERCPELGAGGCRGLWFYTMRSSTIPCFSNHHLLCISQGNISRQEAVSMIPPLLLKIEPHHKVLFAALSCNPDAFHFVILVVFKSDHDYAWTDFGYVCSSGVEDRSAYRDAPFWYGCAVSW